MSYWFQVLFSVTKLSGYDSEAQRKNKGTLGLCCCDVALDSAQKLPSSLPSWRLRNPGTDGAIRRLGILSAPLKLPFQYSDVSGIPDVPHSQRTQHLKF